jgi:hypothetical protein
MLYIGAYIDAEMMNHQNFKKKPWDIKKWK